jgi:signal transduction histidine kinase
MNSVRNLFESSFRAKVLVPVVGVMVLLLTVTAWVLNGRITQQFEAEAGRALPAANEGFRDWQENRTKNLLLRFGDLRNEPRYKAAFQTGDPPTVRTQLNDLLNTADENVKIVLFTTRKAELIGSVKRDPLIPVGDFAAASAAVVKKSLEGEERVDTIQAGGRLYNVVSIPAFDPSGDICGALTFGLELGNEVATELSRFTRSDIVLLADEQVVAKTIAASDSGTRFADMFKELSHETGRSHRAFGIQREVFDGRHYYCSGGRFPSLNGNNTLGYLLLYSYEDSRQALVTTQQILLAVNGLACLFGSLIVCYVVGKVTRPLRDLRDSVEAVGRGDFSRRVQVPSQDECGELAQVFNQMTENLQTSREELDSAHAGLLEASRRAGMAEVATGVLHNVGNVLTSVNVASSLMAESLKKSKAAYLSKLVTLLREHQSDLGDFLTNDPKGKQVPDYLANLSVYLTHEHEATLQELAQLQKGIEHIMEIVKAQQGFSKVSRSAETLEVAELVDDALRMNASLRGNIQIVKELDTGLKLTVEKHKVLQILVNLVRNAKQACDESPADVKKLTIRATNGDQRVRIAVSDNGVGIEPENLGRIFSHGFTTKKDGHGFGLHSCALTARELGGALLVHSDGLGKGATFVLELPVARTGKVPSDDGHTITRAE